MKNFYLLLLGAICCFGFTADAQILNQSAGWPNAAWTVTGTYNTIPTAFEASPVTTANFAFDDDDAGNGSNDNIAAESPVIDLTAAHAGGEVFITATVQYGYNWHSANEYLRFEYWDATAAAWVPWGANFAENSTSIFDNFCTIPKTTHATPALSISDFTPAQLSGFRYRIAYEDNSTGAGYNYGFCLDSPVLTSMDCGAPFLAPVANITSTSADLSWAAIPGIDGFEYVLDNVATDPVSGTATTATNFDATGLSSLTTYYFHIRTDCGSGFSEWQTVSFTTLASPPANDDCDDAVGLTVNPDYNCGVTTPGTLLGASDSGVTDNGAGTPDDDVWFKFVATATTHRIILANVTGTPTDLVHETLSGTCAGLTSVLVSDSNTSNPTGLVIGATYYVRVFSYTTGNTSTTEFTVCVGTLPPVPANNEPSDAIALTVNPDFNCAVTTDGTTYSATASTEAAPSCSATGINDDVWYTFTATATAHRFVYSNVTTGTIATALYTGTPGSLTQLTGACQTGAVQDFTGLTIGTQYYARVYTTVATATTLTNFTVCVGTAPPPPANDNPAGAIGLTVNADLACAVTTNGTTFSATESTEAAPSCSATGINDDVWYTFTATSTEHRFVYSNTSVGTMATALYTGTPGSLTPVENGCLSGDTQTFGGLTVGTMYYARIYTTVATATTQTNFTVCVGTPLPPPSNDNISGAIALTVNTNLTCTAFTSGTTLDATMSAAAAPCNGNPDDDVWYSFVATSTAHDVTLQNVAAVEGGTSTDMYFQVFGELCDELNSILCSDPNTGSVSGLTVGDTYYVRVYSYGTARNTFDICITTPAAPPAGPANDNCTGAIALTVNGDLSCGTVTSGTTVNATTSMAAAPCFGNPDDDVWFSFVATSTSHNVSLLNVVAVTGTSTDMYFQVLSGTCCTLTSMLCSDPNSNMVSGLTVGSTYYVRVYSNAATSRQTFDICIGTPPSPPANDDCGGAIALTVNDDASCAVVTAGTTVGGTLSMAAAPCFGNPDDDVWFSFVATGTSHIVSILDVVPVIGTSTDMYFQVLSGVCGAGTSVLCSDPNTNTVSGLTSGNTYYVRVYSYGAGVYQNFNICIGTPPPPPANDDCSGAIALTAGGVYSDYVTDATNVSATASSTETPPTVCLGYSGGDVWYSVVVPASGNITIETGNSTSGASGVDTVITLYTGTCGALTQVGCDDDGAATAAYSFEPVTGLTPGSILYIRVYEYNNDNSGAFGISAYDESLSNSAFDNANFRYYPNPVKDVLNLSYSNSITSVSVFNLLGQEISTQPINSNMGEIDMSKLASGTYIVKVIADDQATTIKVIKE